MLRTSILVTALLAASPTITSAQLLKMNCQTQGPPFYLGTSTKTTYETVMDENGCRYSYSTGQNSGGTKVLEKAVIARKPAHGELLQAGEFSFFYKPKKGFKGKDSFVVYLCGGGGGSGRGGCARLAYEATVQ